MIIKLVNPDTKEFLYTKTGFSVTTMFFSTLVPLYRGEGKFFWKFLGLSIITLGIYAIVQWFVYNKGFIQRKLLQGWQPASQRDKEVLLIRGVYTEYVFDGADTNLRPFKPNRTGYYILLGINILYLIIEIYNLSSY